MKTYKVPFAYTNDGNIIDVKQAKKGESYFCSCGEEVRLRGGFTISDHFYHISETECSIESQIHKAYKYVFEKVKKIRLPIKVNNYEILEFDRVELERKIDDFIPDAIGYIGEKMYLIEFAKTSFIGNRKLEKIKKSNLMCVETSIIKNVNTLEDIENHIVNKEYYKNIIHIPEYKEMIDLRSKFKDAYTELKLELLSARKQIEFTENIFEGISLFYKYSCKNGARYFKHELGDGRYIEAYVIDKKINLKFKLEPSTDEICDTVYGTI